MAVLPNLALSEAIEAGRAALLPANDARVTAIGRKHPRFSEFMGRFTDTFGRPVAPSVIALSPDAPDSYRTVEALAGFRDSVVMSVVPYSWADELKHPHQHRTLYSDGFVFYPWMVDNRFENLIARTPGLLAVHLVEEFSGQSAPAVPQVHLSEFNIDGHLLGALLVAWNRRYHSRRPTWRDTALFRSLNMANQASRLPAGAEATLYDVGRHISLWVSAFEILTHPGPGERADLSGVLNLIESGPWRARRLRTRRYVVIPAGRGKPPRKGGLPAHIYRRLYELRNDFIHGNPISRKKLIAPGGKPWWTYAAPLYRTALMAFLRPPPATQPPLPSDAHVLGAIIAARLSDPHRDFEAALLTALGGPPRA